VAPASTTTLESSVASATATTLESSLASAAASAVTTLESSRGEVSVDSVGLASAATVLDPSHEPAGVSQSAERVGHHHHGWTKKNCCHRPGCYERYEIRDHSPLQKFCNADCRQALRRVLERERRLRKKVAG
jgi:hypothetical protein